MPVPRQSPPEPLSSTARTRRRRSPRQEALSLIESSELVVVPVARYERADQAWKNRITFVEAVGARVICDLKCSVGFPSPHPAFLAVRAQYFGASAIGGP